MCLCCEGEMMVRGLLVAVVAGMVALLGMSGCAPQRDCMSVGGIEVGCVERGLFG